MIRDVDDNFGVEGSQHALSIVCRVCHNNIPFMTSVFTELHIAFAGAFTILRCTSALRVLSRMLPFVWVLGLAVGVIVEADGKVDWSDDVGGCTPTEQGSLIKAYVMTAVLASCVALYGIGMTAAFRRQGASVERRTWHKARVFIIAAMVTWVPFVVFSFSPEKAPDQRLYHEKSKHWYHVVSAFLELNGLLNTMVYAWQSGFLRKTQRREGLIDQEASPSAHRTISKRFSEVSYDVTFKLENETVMVLADTAEANENAEVEIDALKFGRAQKNQQKQAELELLT